MRLKESQESIVMLIVEILTVRTGSVVNLIVIMVSVAMPSVIMVSVAMPSVVAPRTRWMCHCGPDIKNRN